MPPEHLGRYEILEELRRGAAGPVYLARDPAGDRRVVLQVLQCVHDLPPDRQSAAREDLLREIGRASRVAHPGIVPLIDTDESEGIPFLVAEHVEGVHLDACCDPSHRLDPGTAVELIAAAADALESAHDASVVHGAIRPSNLIRVAGRGVRVADLGLATARRIGSVEPSGLPFYLAPEAVREGRLEPGGDQFALAAVLYELLTGRKAFPGDAVASILYRIVHEDPAEPDPAEVPPQTWRVLRRALAKRPDERFASCAGFAAALRAAAPRTAAARPVARGAGPAASAPPAAPPPARPARTSARPFVLGAALIAAAAGLLLWRGLSGVDRTPPVVWWDARVSTQPPGVGVLLDGVPLAAGDGGVVRFRGDGPFGVLSATQGCRTAEHRLGPEDAGTEVVLVLDPVDLAVQIDPSVDGASVLLNGKKVGATPASLQLDLCRENAIEIRAEGYRAAKVAIPAGAAPLEARTQVYALALERIPRGKLAIPRERGVQLDVYVDGREVAKSETAVELEEGRHALRFVNDYHWVDVTENVEVRSGATTAPEVSIPLATLQVQAFPANCKVYLRRAGGRWRYLDETPAERQVAAGRYDVKVELNPTGETRERTVTLGEGENPPVRISFGDSR
jgi:serine/threonine-protein kinase